MLSPKPLSDEANEPENDERELEIELNEALRRRYQKIQNEEATVNSDERLAKLRESADFWDDEFKE